MRHRKTWCQWGCLAVFSLSIFSSLGWAAAPLPAGPAALQPQQGHYFRWMAPPDWRARESNAGVTLMSPDNRFNASLAMIMRSRGSRTPEQFLRWLFAQVPTVRDVRVLSVKNLPSERLSFQVWQFIEAKVAYIEDRLPVTGLYKAGVANYSGMNDAMIVGYRVVTAELPNAPAYLPQIARSIVLTNAAEASGNNTLIRPKNNPLDNSAILEAGRNRQKGIDEAMRKDANARRGTVDLVDPATGERMNVPTQHTEYYWRKPGSTEIVGTNSPNPPGVGYGPLSKY